MSLHNPFIEELPPIEPLPELKPIPWSKRKHPWWKQCIVGFGIALIIHALIFTTFSLISLDGTGSNPLELYARAYARTIFTHTVANSLNDRIVLNISSECQNVPLEAQAYCVHNTIEPLYHYVNNASNYMIHTPDETVIQGGVCRDWAVMTAAIFRKMGWNVEYNFPIPAHVTLTVWHTMPCDNGHTGCTIFCEFNNDELSDCTLMEGENAG